MKRRDFMRQAGGATAALGAGASATAGTAAAQEGGGGNVKPDFGGYLQGAKGGTYKDLRGSKEVTVTVGGGSSGLAFLPTGIWIDTGTSVTFEWASNGHNVVPESQPQGASWKGSPGGASKLYDQGYTYSHTFDTGGIYQYFCDPHKSLGMLGAIAVGPDVPTESAGGGGPQELHEFGVPLQAHWVGAATVLSVIVAIVYSFYVLKYGESPHTGTGR